MSKMKPMIGRAIGAVVGRRKGGRRQDITDEQVLAHEIRTPLSLIQGAAELLADEEDEGKRRRLVGTIQTNSARAIQIAESLLLQARLLILSALLILPRICWMAMLISALG